ncbi:MAG TPA: MarR family transcriptional regulator [Spongiibacteraceae bacterium]
MNDKFDLSGLRVEDSDGLYQREGYRICESLGYLLKRTVTMLSGAIDQELAQYDLTHPQFSILMILSERNCYTAADLARETCGDTGAITRMLDRLEAKDMVRRVRSVEDRRVVNIELTQSGKLFAEKIPVVAINVLNRHLTGFSKEELETMKGFLRRLLSNGGVPITGMSANT